MRLEGVEGLGPGGVGHHGVLVGLDGLSDTTDGVIGRGDEQEVDAGSGAADIVAPAHGGFDVPALFGQNCHERPTHTTGTDHPHPSHFVRPLEPLRPLLADQALPLGRYSTKRT